MSIINKVNNLLETKEYDFINNNPHLGDNIILLTLGGSYSYGTNNESSDIDIRGVALNSESDILGLSNFNQYSSEETDTVIYSFNRIIQLLSNCNPNVIEILGGKLEYYFKLSDIGKELIDNKKLFLSKKSINSFGGYANAQLRRLQNAIARDSYNHDNKEKHILGSINVSMNTFSDRYEEFEDGSVKLYIDKSEKSDYNTEIFADISLSHYPLRDYKGMWNEMNSIIKDYGKLNNRNKKKDEIHLNKHAMHLVRLYLMLFDILENEEIITYRDKDHDFLMSIRNGEFMNNDGTYRSEFFDLIDEYSKRLEYDSANTSLPDKPDYNKINEFVMYVNRRAINYEF